MEGLIAWPVQRKISREQRRKIVDALRTANFIHKALKNLFFLDFLLKLAAIWGIHDYGSNTSKRPLMEEIRLY